MRERAVSDTDEDYDEFDRLVDTDVLRLRDIARQLSSDIFAEVRAERVRAHEKHGDTSMESSPPDTLWRLAILTEEIGEVAKEFNDAEHDGRPVDLAALRKELIQTAAMAAAWADACGDKPR